MQTRWLLNVFLLFLVAALATAVYFSRNTQDSPVQLTGIDKDSIQTIVIPREQGDIRLSKQNNEWTMETPYQLPTHEFRVKGLLGLLNATIEKTYNLNDLELKQFGLEPPRAIIRFDNTEIHFGKTNPVNQQRYLRVNDKLFLLKEQLYPLISSQPSSFVDISPLPKNIRINKISMPELSVYKNDQGLWQSDDATQNNADRIQQLIENWQSVQAFGVHGYMQRTSLGVVNIEHADGKIQFDITSFEPWLILAWSDAGVEYHFDAGLKDKLLQLPEVTTTNAAVPNN